MTTPAWYLSDDPSPEEIEWKGNLWWFTIDVSDWIDEIWCEQLLMLYFERDYV